ncbi:hypothetical protein MKY89_28530 [Bacillus sp. FSL W7-1294]
MQCYESEKPAYSIAIKKLRKEKKIPAGIQTRQLGSGAKIVGL